MFWDTWWLISQSITSFYCKKSSLLSLLDQDYEESLMNTQGLIITITMHQALGEEEVGKRAAFIIPEGIFATLYSE